MRQRSDNFDRVTLLLRRGDLAKLREMARQKGCFTRIGPNTGEPSVAMLVRAIIDEQALEFSIDLAKNTTQDPAEQAEYLKRAVAILEPQLAELKVQVDDMIRTLERRGQAALKPQVTAQAEAGESAEATE